MGAIADYFDTVPTRLGDADVLFEPIEPLGKDQAKVAYVSLRLAARITQALTLFQY